MSSRTKGLQKYTIQEAQNAAMGQAGALFCDDTSTSLVAPTNAVFVAIQCLTDVKFDNANGLIAEKDPHGHIASDTHYLETNSAANFGGSTGGCQVDNSNVFPKGMTIYGRWTTISLDTGAIIAYVG